MAETLGEKLRQAREEREISISEVAEQTRISALYLEAIENDDYSALPGGIFNKGFVKSFAKYVGVDEHEALQDYAKVVAEQQASNPESQTSAYRPQVLTDDSRSGSMLPTIIVAVLILGLMAWGIHALVKYVQSTESGTSGDDSLLAANVKEKESPPVESNANTNVNPDPTPMPATDSIKVKISTKTDDPLSVTATADGTVQTLELSVSEREKTIEAAQSLKLRYYKGLAGIVAIEVNGTKIQTPVPPEGYRDNGLEYEITLENIKKILKDGRIEFGRRVAPAGTPDVTNGANPGNAQTNAMPANANVENAN